MTQYEPTLIVTRLVVKRNGHIAYDEAFHEGVNVIRGENSSGKSTILNFIFYGLGGDLTDWSDTALLCTDVFVEVDLNGKKAVLSREVTRTPRQPMEVFGGDYQTAMAASRAEWIKYPYLRSESKESFSQALFRLLGLPEVADEVSSNVTMHQILRLLYADQLSPVENLFRFEPFDPPTLRDVIGRFLCGVYDSSLYNNELKIRTLQSAFDSAQAELRSLFAVLGKTEAGATLEWIAGQKKALTEEQRNLQKSVEELERQIFTSAQADELTLKAQEVAYTEVQELQKSISSLKQERDALLLTSADSAAFISSLEKKVEALNDSSIVAQHITEVRFSACPACYTPVEEMPSQSDTPVCHLCRTPFDSERAKGRIVSLINDAAIQLKQSRLLQERRQEKLIKLNKNLADAEKSWQKASKKLEETQRLPSGELREKLRELNKKSGYLERQLENIDEKEKIASLINELSTKKADLNDQITRLKADNDAIKTVQNRRISEAYTLVSEEIKSLLQHDLRRQDAFENPQSISFDFIGNKISVDGQTYFSASSRVILKSSFFVSLLSSATKADYFRHPRFCMIDTIEDKGMEPARSHNFQMQIARISQEAKVRHQIIYATAMIAPDLDDEKYTIGKFSTRDDPTLSITV